MHIPDGFLSVPVWGTMDAVALPSIAYLARRAQREFEHHRIPLMGVMGAFIFAAQTINFPVGNGTSGHLVGGALLSFTLGPAAAAVVMTAILATQALVFQDGGLLALGANVFNMAIAGVLAGYVPFVLLRGRKAGVFLGGMISVLVSAGLALVELNRSGVPMPRAVLWISVGLFAVSAVIEGAITLAVVGALEKIQPGFLLRPVGIAARGRRVLIAVAACCAVLGAFVASTRPDGIQRLTSSSAVGLLPLPVAGLVGLLVVYLVCAGIGRALEREGT